MSEVIVGISLFTLLGGIALVMAFFGPRAFDRMPSVIGWRNRLEMAKLRESHILKELTTAQDTQRGHETQLAKLERELKLLVERRNLFPKDKPLPVVELGLPLLTNKLFEAHIHNNAVLRARRTKEMPPFNPFWEVPRYVLIWAEGVNEARAELLRNYPPQNDWHVELRGEVAL